MGRVYMKIDGMMKINGMIYPVALVWFTGLIIGHQGVA